MKMKIDVFAHILPEKYLAIYSQKNKAVLDQVEVKNRAVIDLDTRLRLMDRYPDVLQVLPSPHWRNLSSRPMPSNWLK